jgi:outer membrane protein OmpA-like peptidoglycan-associated protein
MGMVTLAGAMALAMSSSVAGQAKTMKPNYDEMYCSGLVTTSPVSAETYIISGEEASPTTVFGQNAYVYINKGSGAGVKIGDEFLVTRATKDRIRYRWFEAQSILSRAMGTQWVDVGRIKVVALSDRVATAQVMHVCDMMQRGDLVVPFAERPAPTFRNEAFDRFAAPSGRGQAMVVHGKYYGQMAATRDIVYINLGSGQGVNVGDYFRVYRYQGRGKETAYQLRNMQDRVWGWGAPPSASERWSPTELPQEALGEGIVLRTSDTSSTVLITYSLKPIYAGDYVELKAPGAAPAMAPAPAPAARANRPPTLAVSVDRPSVMAGERIRVTGRGADPDGDNLNYQWRTSGGQLSGSGASVGLDTTGLAPGRYTVTGRVDDGKGGAGDGSASFTVESAGAVAAPQAAKINEGFFRETSAQPDNILKRILDDVATRLQSDARARVLLIGYADAGEANPDQLATQRAANSKSYLVAKGLSASRINTRIAAGQSGAGRQNRRIDVIWLPEGASY